MKLKHFLLNKVRLTQYLVIFAVIFFIIALFLPKIDLQGAALTLFSVNSFLYGFYISPIINAQRLRIDHLHRLVVVEVNKLQEIVQYSLRMEPEFQNNIAQMHDQYVLAASVGGVNPGQKEFNKLTSLIVGYEGDKKDPHKEMLKSVFAAQQNRSEIKLLVESKVYSNEWIVMSILFAITIAFILFTRLPDIPLLQAIPAILCAGLSMLIIILIKMSTLTHKRAKTIWVPLRELANVKK
jgi:uncharacterized membrane protein YagU involved in acid resistance